MVERNGDSTDRDTVVSRRGVLAATGAVSVTLMAGCSGGDGGTGTDEPTDGGSTATGTAEPTDDGGEMSTPTDDGGETSSVPGSVSSNVAELSIVEHQPDIDYYGENNEQYFPVDLTIENNGDQQTDVTEYDYDVTPYDADGNDVSGGRLGTSSGEGTSMEPGGRGTLIAYATVEIDPSEVARYEVTLMCEDSVSDFESAAAYCQ